MLSSIPLAATYVAAQETQTCYLTLKDSGAASRSPGIGSAEIAPHDGSAATGPLPSLQDGPPGFWRVTPNPVPWSRSALGLGGADIPFLLDYGATISTIPEEPIPEVLALSIDAEEGVLELSGDVAVPESSTLPESAEPRDKNKSESAWSTVTYARGVGVRCH